MEIKINDYVRFSNGQILKVIDIKKYYKKYVVYITDREYDKYNDRDANGYNFVNSDIEDICKVSSNIIDLIEVGDYVNGVKIHEINKENKLLWHLTFYGDDDIAIQEKEIKDIVTKEQFKGVQYEVK